MNKPPPAQPMQGHPGKEKDKEHGQEQDAPIRKQDTATEGRERAKKELPENPEDSASD